TTRRSFRWQPPAIAFGVMALAAVYLAATIGGRQASLFLVGALAGIVLYHAAFGFTSSWRALIVDARGRGVRAQMLMLALTCLVFFPVLGSGHFFGQAVRGSLSPLGIGVLVGAFLFGVGMQLGGGCASGTLYSASGGDLRMVVTLIAFIAGAVIGSAHLPWWEALPGAKAISLVTTFGVAGGLAVSLAAFAAVAAITVWIERRRHGSLEQSDNPGNLSSWWRGPWPIVAGAIGLAAADIGGLMLGYGARIAYGCNIGAFFSGIASGSVHGWIWFPAALAGNFAGTRLRPLFGLRMR